MKLDPEVLRIARKELTNHLSSDLQYAVALRDFMKNKIDAKTYLESEFGFKKFILAYGIGRTLGAGDESKLKILEIIKSFAFEKSHAGTITSMASYIQMNGLSSNAAKGGYGLPRSFCSKLMYVYKPDELIPYDSYVLKSLVSQFGGSIKELHYYYDRANEFRFTFFPENGVEVRRLRKKHDDLYLTKMKSLRINPDKLFSWKLTDKYLWCEEQMKRS
ncbi:MAG: hypothetical protein M3R25_08750 [Bacteroidota bacterium]|nr:hypothetical protein [Bacteroidota bacterium]